MLMLFGCSGLPASRARVAISLPHEFEAFLLQESVKERLMAEANQPNIIRARGGSLPASPLQRISPSQVLAITQNNESCPNHAKSGFPIKRF